MSLISIRPERSRYPNTIEAFSSPRPWIVTVSPASPLYEPTTSLHASPGAIGEPSPVTRS